MKFTLLALAEYDDEIYCDVFVTLILALTFDIRVGTNNNPPSNISVITFIEELNCVLWVFVP